MAMSVGEKFNFKIIGAYAHQLIVVLSGLTYQILITKELPIKAFATYAVFLSVFNIIRFISNGGLSTVILTKNKSIHDTSSMLIVQFTLFLFISVILFLVGDFIVSIYSLQLNINIIRYVLFATFFSVFSSFSRGLLMKNYSYHKLIFADLSSYVAAILTVIYFDNVDEVVLIVAFIVRLFVFFIISNLLIFNFFQFSFDKENLKETFVLGISFSFSGLINKINKEIVTVILANAVSPTELGIYNRSMSFLGVGSGLVIKPLNRWYLPKLASIKQNKQIWLRNIKTSFFVLLIFNFLFVVAVFSLGELRFLSEKWSTIFHYSRLWLLFIVFETFFIYSQMIFKSIQKINLLILSSILVIVLLISFYMLFSFNIIFILTLSQFVGFLFLTYCLWRIKL